jgi:hypothetical protein
MLSANKASATRVEIVSIEGAKGAPARDGESPAGGVDFEDLSCDYHALDLAGAFANGA